jgi:phage terminase Nu1 subunit (DNA packaging protein)
MNRDAPGGTHSPGRIVNRRELAELLGVVPSAITKYVDLGMPVFKRGVRREPD